MSITAREAAAVAKKHGLSLADARALSVLAETVEEAEELAAGFAPAAMPETAPDDPIEAQLRGILGIPNPGGDAA